MRSTSRQRGARPPKALDLPAVISVKSSSNVLTLILLLLLCNGFNFGLLAVDLAFDYGVALRGDSGSRLSAFAFYTVILNNPLINVSLATSIFTVMLGSYKARSWARNSGSSSSSRVSVGVPSSEGGGPSRRLRAAFPLYSTAVCLFLAFVFPRYLPFMPWSSSLSSSSSSASSPSSTSFSSELFDGWSAVLLARIAISAINVANTYILIDFAATLVK